MIKTIKAESSNTKTISLVYFIYMRINFGALLFYNFALLYFFLIYSGLAFNYYLSCK